MLEQLKKVKDVFPDFNSDIELLNAQIKDVNLYKKTNKLQVNIAASKGLNITEIEDF